MKSQMETRNVGVRAFDITMALTGDQCPYCGACGKDLQSHLAECGEVQKNVEFAGSAEWSRWATHPKHGKMMVLAQAEGLCLAENEEGRYVLPASSMKFGELAELISRIEEAELADDETAMLINVLRLKMRDHTKIPAFPELNPGCRIEIQCGEKVQTATIRGKRGSCYKATLDASNTAINVSPKEVIRII